MYCKKCLDAEYKENILEIINKVGKITAILLIYQ